MYLSSRVAIVIFVFISQSKLLGEFLLHLVVRHLFTQSLKRTHPKYSVSVREQHSHVLWWTIIVCGKEMLTASISLRAFHCSYGTPRCSAVWMALHSWLVQTLRSFICCSSTNRAKAAENYSREGSSCQHLKLIHYSVQILVILLHCRILRRRLWLFIPVGPAARGLRRRPAGPPRCQCSPRADTGRWFGAGRGCSSGSRRSYSGCGPGCG